MSPDDAADLLADLPQDRARRLISLMEKEDAETYASCSRTPSTPPAAS